MKHALFAQFRDDLVALLLLFFAGDAVLTSARHLQHNIASILECPRTMVVAGLRVYWKPSLCGACGRGHWGVDALLQMRLECECQMLSCLQHAVVLKVFGVCVWPTIVGTARAKLEDFFMFSSTHVCFECAVLAQQSS